MFKKSGNPKVEELTKSVRERSYNLSSLSAIKLETGRFCAWCAEGKLNHGNQKYCSTHCSQSAMAWAYPQKEDALRYLLMAQDWKCAGCQFDYKPIMEQVVERDRRAYGSAYDDYTNLPWHYFKRLKSRCAKERNPEVDHIVPIYKGGESLGLANHQILCYTCHKTKTSSDLKGKRK